MRVSVVMDGLDLVLTEVGGVPIGLLAHQVMHSRPCHALTSDAPNLTEWLGLLPTEMPALIALSLRMAEGVSVDVCCSAPVTLVAVPHHAVFPLPDFIAARCQLCGLSAIAIHNTVPVFVIDLSVLTKGNL